MKIIIFLGILICLLSCGGSSLSSRDSTILSNPGLIDIQGSWTLHCWDYKEALLIFESGFYTAEVTDCEDNECLVPLETRIINAVYTLGGIVPTEDGVRAREIDFDFIDLPDDEEYKSIFYYEDIFYIDSDRLFTGVDDTSRPIELDYQRMLTRF